MEIENNRVLATLTVGEYKEIMKEIGCMQAPQEEKPHTFVYGIPGIMQLFGVSRSTAQSLKNTVLQEAISQNGRKIVVDVEIARALFDQRKYLKRAGHYEY